ncbi:MAG: acetate--CoA ligase family protein [archaeon]|nr:acetate--CoA ligase family protein [archaeon]
MKIYTEKGAEDFLEKEGFEIVERAFIKNEKELKKITDKIGFPLVMKISSKKLIHKTKHNGVKIDINNYEEALQIFNKFKKSSYFEGVLIQKMIEGKEFLIGLKKTKEFGHVIAFGVGGIYAEQFKEISFRACPVDKKEIQKMITEIKQFKDLDKNIKDEIVSNIIKTCSLSKKYPSITELDINPLIIGNKKGKIVDVRIVFE